MDHESRVKLLSWSLQVTDLENLTEYAFKWYERGLDYPNLFSFTREGEFFFSSSLDPISREDWNYLVSILGATCIGFLIECSRASANCSVRLWKMEGGTISTCCKETANWEETLGFAAGLERQLARTGVGYKFQRNWPADKEKIITRISVSDGEDCVFADEDAEFYEAKIHLELLQPPQENPGDFSRYRLK